MPGAGVRGVSVLARALQPHDHEGGGRQFLVNEEHERSSQDRLQQLGFKAFVESRNSKTPYSLVKEIENVPKTPQCSVFWVESVTSKPQD